MNIKLKDSYQFLILCILCIIFICIKIPNLNIPFFWDEAWVYGPAIRSMAQSGVGLLPNALSGDYSRGHPLLFFFTGAIWVKIFGGTFFSMHLFSLVVAVSFIFTLFYIVNKLFDSTLALIVASITLTQSVFIAQSAITLPEIFLALWAILTIYHFVIKNKYYYFLFGTLLVLTKESGVVVIISLMIYESICFFTQKITTQSFNVFIRNSLLAFAPIVPFIGFLIIQHIQKGYYFFPEHIGLLNFNWSVFQEKAKYCYDYLFERQLRVIITWSFLLVFGVLYKPIPRIIRFSIVIGLMICVKVFFRFWPISDWLMILFIGAFTCMFYYFMHIKYRIKLKKAEKALAISFIIGIAYLVFSSINFFTNRYMFLLIPLMILYFSYYVKESLQFRFFLPYCWGILMVSLMVYGATVHCNYTGDDSPKYIQGIKLEQEIVKYLEDRNLQKSNIYCNFTVQFALNHKDCGFLSGPEFTNTKTTLDKNTEYVIYTNVDYDTLWSHGCDTLPHFKIVKKFDCGVANGKLFKRVLQSDN